MMLSSHSTACPGHNSAIPPLCSCFACVNLGAGRVLSVVTWRHSQGIDHWLVDGCSSNSLQSLLERHGTTTSIFLTRVFEHLLTCLCFSGAWHKFHTLQYFFKPLVNPFGPTPTPSTNGIIPWKNHHPKIPLFYKKNTNLSKSLTKKNTNSTITSWKTLVLHLWDRLWRLEKLGRLAVLIRLKWCWNESICA